MVNDKIIQSNRDPYQAENICLFDGNQKNAIRIYGNNQKNNSNFTLSWDVPNDGQKEKVSNKVGNECSSFIPEYSVKTFQRSNLQSTPQQFQQETPKKLSKFAQIATKNLQEQPKQKLLILEKYLGLHDKTNKQIQELIQKQRLENQKYLKDFQK